MDDLAVALARALVAALEYATELLRPIAEHCPADDAAAQLADAVRRVVNGAAPVAAEPAPAEPIVEPAPKRTRNATPAEDRARYHRARGKSGLAMISWRGETLTIGDWSRRFNINRGVLKLRAKRGLPLDAPPMGSRRKQTLSRPREGSAAKKNNGTTGSDAKEPEPDVKTKTAKLYHCNGERATMSQWGLRLGMSRQAVQYKVGSPPAARCQARARQPAQETSRAEARAQARTRAQAAAGVTRPAGADRAAPSSTTATRSRSASSPKSTG